MRGKQKRGSDKVNYILLAAAVVLLSASGVGSANAALTYFSENYTAQVEMYDIGVTLTENIRLRHEGYQQPGLYRQRRRLEESQGVLLEDMLEETDGTLLPGREYTEELAVRNSGNIDEYVRVRIYKYWTSEDGSREQDLAPALIDLNFTDNGWILDESAATEERTVLYWPQVLPVGASTPAFTDTLAIDSSITSKVSTETRTEGGVTTTVTTFDYDGVQVPYRGGSGRCADP